MPFSSPIHQSDLDAASIDIAVHWTSYDGHGGVDFNGVDVNGNSLSGIPVRASEAGTLYRAADHPALGLLVILDHGGGRYSLYSHLGTYASALQSFIDANSDADPTNDNPQITIGPGDVLGTVGNSGSASTGTHLHFSVLDLPVGVTLNRTGALGVSEGQYSIMGWAPGETRADQYERILALSPELAALADHPVHIVDDNNIGSAAGDTTWDTLSDSDAETELTTTGSIERPGDKDWIKIELHQRGNYSITVTGQEVNDYNAISDVFFNVKQASSVPGEYENIDASDAADRIDATGPNEVLNFTVAETGDYYLVVGGGGTNFANETGGYQVEISAERLLSFNELAKISAALSERVYEREGRDPFISLSDWSPPGDTLLGSGITTQGEQYSYDPADGSYTVTVQDIPGSIDLFSIDRQFSVGWLQSTVLPDGRTAIALAFRGTDRTVELLDQLGEWDRYYDAMQPLVSEAVRLAEMDDVAQFIVTGHSLGGILANYFSQDASTASVANKTTVVTFGSPGVTEADRLPAVHTNTFNFVNLDDPVAFPPFDFQYDFERPGTTYHLESTFTPPLVGTDLDPSHDMRGYISEVEYFTALRDLVELDPDRFQFAFGDNFHGYPTNADVLEGPRNDSARSTLSYGLSGNDTINGGNLDDTFYGGDGDDLIYGGDGFDYIGFDSDSGVGENDVSLAAANLSTGVAFFSDGSVDRFFSIEGVLGSSRSEVINGDDEHNSILGNGGDDEIYAGDGNDAIYGGAGNDDLRGEAGADTIFGDDGNDTLEGGTDSDTLEGGAGSDVFRYQQNEVPESLFAQPIDRITDYNQGDVGSILQAEGDLIDISAVQFATSSGFGTQSTVRLRSVDATAAFPSGTRLEVDTGLGIWSPIASLDNVSAGDSVQIALTDAHASTGIGVNFVVDGEGDGTTWSISPQSQQVEEGNRRIEFTITRTGSNLSSETVYASTVQDQGFYNELDYDGRTNVPVEFIGSQTAATFYVDINADAFNEGDETFGVIVQADPSDHFSVFKASATFTIENADAPDAAGETYEGDALSNIWSGTSNADLAFGYGGDDRLDGDGGSDVLFGGDGSDTIQGDSGNDVIVLGAGADYADAGSGNDYIDARQAYAENETVIGGEGDDTIQAAGISRSSDTVLTVEGGSGVDTLIIQASRDQYLIVGVVYHQFGSDGDLLASWSSFDDIEAAIATGDSHYVSTSRYAYNSTRAEAWILSDEIELFEYRGASNADLFLDWSEAANTYLGGGGTDVLYADWSTATVDINWNLTVDNDVEKTLANGVVVQSIELAMLKTGAGNDHLVLGRYADHVVTGAGNDVIVLGDGVDYADAGAGNDYIDARQSSAQNETVIGGDGDDIFIVTGRSNYSDNVITVEGGSGEDTLIIEASSFSGYLNVGYATGYIYHQFGLNGDLLTSLSNFDAIETAIAIGGSHYVSTSRYSAYSTRAEAWVLAKDVERFEYRGASNTDLFLDWNGTSNTFLGGGATDAIYADWSGHTVDIDWNLTVDNEAQKTLTNGVVVQSIERALLKTGSGDDHLVLGRYEDHVVTGSGNDVIVLGEGIDYADAGSGNDYIDARQSNAQNETVIGGDGDDTILARGISIASDRVLTVEGGSGEDTLIVEAASNASRTIGVVYHQFGSDGDLLTSSSNFETIEAAIASGDPHYVSTSRYSAYSTRAEAWVLAKDVERFEYRGASNTDLFLDWNGTSNTFLGGGATDAIYADWSGHTVDIDWNLTVDNEAQKTLTNGVVVQSIERAMLKTGSGNDHLVLGRYEDHVVTGSGNDVIVLGEGIDYADAGSGNDYIDARQSNAQNETVIGGDGDDTILARGISIASDRVLTVEGGSGEDTLIVEAASNASRTIGVVYHQFGSDGDLLTSSSNFETIEAAIASGDPHYVSTSRYSAYSTRAEAWVLAKDVERFEYRGASNTDLFLDWNGTSNTFLGGGATDAIYADWSGHTVDIDWNLTVDNEAQKTLTNGVVVQSIERAMLKTGSGNDHLVLGGENDRVETGAGNDLIVLGEGVDYADGGAGNDYIDARQSAAQNETMIGGDGDDTILASGISAGSDRVLTVEGGSGADTLIVEASGNSAYVRGVIYHQFGPDGDLLTSSSSFDAIEEAIATGAPHYVSTSGYNFRGNNSGQAWVLANEVERFEYRGAGSADLFLDWNGTSNTFLGGGATDVIYADWSDHAVDIDWNLTVDNEAQKTLANGVVVQSIERAMLKTGSGDDYLVFGADNDLVESAAGNDMIVLGEGIDYADAGSGNDYIDARQFNAQNETVIGGDGDDTILARGISSTSDKILTVEGGSGADTLIVEASSNSGYVRGVIYHQFGPDGDLLTSSSSFDAIEEAIATGASHYVSTSGYNFRGSNSAQAWVLASEVERFEYRGAGSADLFLDWNGTSNTFLGGGATDVIYADWSDHTVDIDWNLTVDNEAQKTLANGVVVQSIERAMLKTGSGDDHLVLGSYNDYAATGAGNDTVVTGSGNDLIDGGQGDDMLSGGAGRDIFAFDSGSGDDTITDFSVGEDIIDIVDLEVLYEFLEIIGRENGSLVRFETDSSAGSIFLEGVDAELLTASSFSISPDAVAPSVVGSVAPDNLSGTDSNEALLGLAGNDTLEGGGGSDTLDGGGGEDTAEYGTSAAGVVVDLDTGTGSNGDAAGDALISIEHVSGSSYDDILTGDGNDNALTGLQGNDTLNGRAGNDTLDGGLGNDRFFVDSVDDMVIEAAGEGTDLITTAVDFTLPEHVENGSSSGTGNIAITGNALANFITGNTGNNHLRGEAGSDRLLGRDGDDTLEGGADNDILEGGSGANRYVFAANNGDDQIRDWQLGVDVLDFETLGLRLADLRITSSGNETLITFDDPGASSGTGTGSARLVDIDPEVLEIDIVTDPGGVGSPGGIPLLAGTSGSNNLAGTAAAEDLIGLAGADTLNGRAGDDTMLGGFGDDRYLLDDAGDIALELEFQGIDQVDTRFDLVLPGHIERGAVRGGGAVNITGNELDNFITGSDLTNVLIGGDGRDRLIARAGNDTLDGGLDNDVLEGGAGEDVFIFDVDSGIDVIQDFTVGQDVIDVRPLGISFADMTIVDGPLGALVIFDLAPGSIDLVTVRGVQAADLRLASFLTVFGDNQPPIVGTEGPDVLSGTVEDDELQGLGDDDRLDGLGGADTLIGGPGDDRYFIDNPGDVVLEQAGEGTDLVTTNVDFTLPEHAEDLNTQTTAAVNLTGNTLANVLNGNDAVNVLTGLAGDDNLLGKAGADTLNGGTGFDMLRGGADADVFVFAPGDGATGDQIIDFELNLDTIDLSATGLTFGDLTITDVGANATITYGMNTVTVFNTSAAELDNNQFDFVG